ncbi:MAG: S-layer homology domain-containing protein, partial [Bacillota bacterium]
MKARPVLVQAVLCFWLVICLALPASASDSVDASLQRACAYLSGQQVSDYPWASIALRAAGCPRAGDFSLSRLPEDGPTTGLVRMIIAGTLFGSPGTEEAVTRLQHLQLKNGKFADNTAGQGEELVNAHVWAIIALAAAGRETPDGDAALAWLLEQQHADGGFSYGTSVPESDVDITAMALCAMKALGLEADSPPVTSAFSFLHSRQQPGGGFVSWGVESCESCAWVIQALVAYGMDPQGGDWTQPGGNPVQALLALQRPDGSFAHYRGGPADIIATSQALLALGDLKRGRPFWAPPRSGRFSDLGPEHWAHAAVAELAARGIVSGYADGSFRPQAPVTRAELACLLTRALDLNPPVNSGVSFVDLTADHWAYRPVATAVHGGLLRGRPGGCFAPQDKVRGAELVAVLCRMAKLSVPPAAGPWWTGPVEAGRRAGLLYPGFSPEKPAGRAQV